MDDIEPINEVERLLGGLTPRGADRELRPRVLAAVESRLQAKSPSPWLRRSAVAVAASILLGMSLNVLVSKMSERHLAQVFGPPPVSKQAAELAKAVGEVTDAQTARWVYQRTAMPRPARDASAKYYAAVERLIRELQIAAKDSEDETSQKDPQMDRHRSGRAGGDSSDCQRLLRLDYWRTA